LSYFQSQDKHFKHTYLVSLKTIILHFFDKYRIKDKLFGKI